MISWQDHNPYIGKETIRQLYLDSLLLHVGHVVVAGAHHPDVVDQHADLVVQGLHLLDNLADVVSIAEVGHDGCGVHLVRVPDLVGHVLQLLLVSADQDDIEAMPGQGQGVLSPNSLGWENIKVRE